MQNFDLQNEKLMPLSQLPKALGMELTYQAVHSWHKNGRPHPKTGEIVRLEAIHTPSGKRTSVEAYFRFIEALNK